MGQPGPGYRTPAVCRHPAARPSDGAGGGPEFLNRIDEIILFRSLDRAQLRSITELHIGQTRRRLHGQDITLDVTPGAVEWLASTG
jgi:hypothetical protein